MSECKQIRVKLIIDLETCLDSGDAADEDDEYTVRYLVEEDLQDLGYDVNEVVVEKTTKQNRERTNNKRIRKVRANNIKYSSIYE